VAVYDALEQAGITIPFPQRDLHLRSVSAEARDALGS
jgi:small-conductance mechanosensitive channel